MAHDQLDGEPAHELEGRERGMRALLGETEERERGGRVGQPDEGGRLLLGLGEQLQRRRRDDAERALRADEKIAQVVAGVVLLQSLEAVPDLAAGEHHLEPEREVARAAVGEHADAAGVGGERAADLAAPLRRQAQREQPPGPVGVALCLGEREPRFDHHRARVDLAHAVEAGHRQHDLGAAERWDLAADEPGVAGLRHDADARLVGGSHYPRNFFCGLRPQHQRRAP